MTKPKKKKHPVPTSPLMMGKCLECDQQDCPGHAEARRLRREAVIRVNLMIDYYGWTDFEVQ